MPLPGGVIDILAGVDGLQIDQHDGEMTLRGEGRSWRLLALRPTELRHHQPTNSPGVLPVVVATVLSAQERHDLASAGVSYADARGHVHLVADGLFVHVDAPGRPGRREGGDLAQGFGATSVRAVQALLGDPLRTWTVADLAQVAHMSAGQAHAVLASLERLLLVVSEGRGRAKRRRVREPGELLDWLAAQPAAHRVSRRLPCTIYARSFLDLVDRISTRLADRKIDYAWSGAAAASLLGAGPTAVPRPVVRVDPALDLDRVAEAIGATPSDAGANLVLWSDTGQVGTSGAIERDGKRLAPPVRVYLDLLRDRRGADAAAHFREVVLGY